MDYQRSIEEIRRIIEIAIASDSPDKVQFLLDLARQLTSLLMKITNSLAIGWVAKT